MSSHDELCKRLGLKSYHSKPYLGFFLERYADGRHPCNCGNAYYKNCGTAYVGGKMITDHPICESGCDANQYRAAEEVAKRIYEEFIEGK